MKLCRDFRLATFLSAKNSTFFFLRSSYTHLSVLIYSYTEHCVTQLDIFLWEINFKINLNVNTIRCAFNRMPISTSYVDVRAIIVKIAELKRKCIEMISFEKCSKYSRE